MNFGFLFLILLSSILISGCIDTGDIKKGIDDITRAIDRTTDKTTSILDKAIDELGNSNADWQRILQETIDKLDESTQKAIRNEISNTLNRAIGASGVEFRCNNDFIRNRVRQD